MRKVLTLLIVLFCVPLLFAEFKSLPPDQVFPQPEPINNQNFVRSPIVGDYEARLRIFISEPDSRWRDAVSANFNFGFLNYAFNGDVTVEKNIPYIDTITWVANVLHVPVSQYNLVAQAALYNPVGVTRYSDPPSDRPYTAYPVDAAAQALPGEADTNSAKGMYTHRVFTEMGVSTT